VPFSRVESGCPEQAERTRAAISAKAAMAEDLVFMI
jgi:hypothetical protein